MEEILNLVNTSGGYEKYWILAGVGLVVSLGIVPTTTDLLLICTGIFSYMGIFSLEIAAPMVVVCVLIGECTVFHLGHFIGPRILQMEFVMRKFSEARQVKIQQSMKNNELKTLLFLRFTPIYKATSLFCFSCLGLSKRSYVRRYIFITLMYAAIYIFGPYLLSSVFDITPKYFIAIMVSLILSSFIIQFCTKLIINRNQEPQPLDEKLT